MERSSGLTAASRNAWSPEGAFHDIQSQQAWRRCLDPASVPGLKLLPANYRQPFSHGSGPGSEDCREPLRSSHRELPVRASAACYFGVVIHHRIGDAAPPWGFKSPLGHIF